MSFGAIAIGAIAGTGLAVASSIMESKAQAKAARTRASGIAAVEEVDIDELKKLVEDTDLERYRKAFAAQAEIDPEFAKLRSEGAKQLLRVLSQDEEAARQYSPAIADLLKEVTSDERLSEIVDMLYSRARQHLQEGARLPDDVQAEFVKAGLERAGGAGLNLDGRGATGSVVRQLLGTAGLQLQAQREQQALSAASTASELQNRRLAALQNLLSLDQSLRQARFGAAQTATALGTSALPSIGLSGADVGNVFLQNQQLANWRTVALADARAAEQLAKGSVVPSILGAVSSGLGQLVGIYGAQQAATAMAGALGSNKDLANALVLNSILGRVPGR